MNKRYRYLLMAFVIIVLVLIPIVMYKNVEFTGTDDKAVTAIQSIDKNYHPWFDGVKIFRSKELISTFFSLQAALGAGVLGYYIGYSRGKRTNERK
jgi:cobalt/nickel transport protein